jgi:2-C-methyl-D-erythritol 4-phosphate cytidylyltransferase
MFASGVGAIIVAAGSSRRMAGADKLWLDICGAPLLARTIAAIVAGCEDLKQLVVVAGQDTIDRAGALRACSPWCRVDRWVTGGETRQDSVHSGLQVLEPCELVLVHDGARPLIGASMIARGLAVAREHGSALAAVPVTDTIKVVDEHGRVTATPKRSALHAAQTPQIFAWEPFVDAYARAGAVRATCTDDAEIFELAGYQVYTYLGDRINVKVTTPDDVAIVRALWRTHREVAE